MRHVPALTAITIVGLSIAGCGGSGGDDSAATAADQPAAQTQTAAAPAAPAAARHALTIRMSEFAFDPKDSSAKAGKVTITAPNDGQTVHELVVLKTDASPASLPKKGGKIDESKSVGEIADVGPGATKKKTLDLAAGKYAIVCALPGHYEGGMYGSITVK